MTEEQKIGRQDRGKKKTNYHFRLQDDNYDWLCRLALRSRVSVAKVLNTLLESRRKADEIKQI